MIYSRLRSTMNLLLRIVTNVMLGLLLSMRSITMRRSLALPRIIIIIIIIINVRSTRRRRNRRKNRLLSKDDEKG
jgi:hypothetical protein